MTRALVVDDAPDVRFLIREVLARAGLEVTEACSGPDAIRYLADTAPPDVVILDVQMPDMDGWETLATIRSGASTADVAVVLCTVKSNPSDAIRAWELGCDAVLGKPFDIRDLADTAVAVTLRSNEERQSLRTRELCAARAALGQPL